MTDGTGTNLPTIYVFVVASDAGLSRSQSNSFRFNQHIGLNEPQVINASQLNNRIKVQFQFDDNDRFAVQSKGPKESIDSNVNCQAENVSCYIGSGNTEKFPTYSSNSNIHLISNVPEDGDFSQFNVNNILGYDGNYLSNNTQNNSCINVENDWFDHHSQARQYFNQFMQNENTKCQKHVYINCSVKDKPKPNSLSLISILNPTDAIINEKKKAKYFAPSNEYFRNYLELVKKQKTGKNKTKLLASFTDSFESTQANDFERMNLTDQCGDKLADLKKHNCRNHNKGKSSEINTDQEAEGDGNVIDVTMGGERDERDNNISDDRFITGSDKMEIESEYNEPHSYLCTICGYDSSTIEESNSHKESHKDEIDHERAATDMHKGQQEYYKSNEMVENRKREEEERKQKEEQAKCLSKVCIVCFIYSFHKSKWSL